MGVEIRIPKSDRARRAVEKRAPKFIENGKKTLILQGTKTSNMLNNVLAELYHLKRGSAIRYTRKNENIRPFDNGGETSLEFYSLKTDCIGVENFKSMKEFSYDKKLVPRVGSKPFFAFIGEGFESVEELKHLKEVLLDMFRGETKNVKSDFEGVRGRVYIPDQEVGAMPLFNNPKGLKRERREGKDKKEKKEKDNDSQESKKQKLVAE
ncbi:hypothetical protein MKW94_017530 [Papaver nudicaule]|uniref:Ribosome production factor 2 homolog n=1 Tax=Papaver nudicaule TaxID=74823 RepID=A0AA41UZ77_PAPNU|nr:hypothetical protein [Papaver nudicaule]